MIRPIVQPGLFIVGAVALLASAAAVQSFLNTYRAHYFAGQLAAASVTESVVTEDAALTVDHGTVRTAEGAVLTGTKALPALRIAYAKTLTRRTPLLALAGTNPAYMERMAKELGRLAEGIASVQKTEAEKKALTESLYPTSYLAALAQTERARQTFLASGRDADLAAYEEAQRKSLAEFFENLSAYETSFISFVPHTERIYAMGESVVSYRSILKLIDDLRAGARAAQETLKNRSYCLRGAISYCRYEDADLPSLPLREKPDVSAAAAAQARDILSIYRSVREEPASVPYTLVVLSESGCSDTNATPPLYALSQQSFENNASAFRKLFFVGDLRFIKTDTYRSVPFYEFFSNRDVAYVPTARLIHYGCPEFGRDTAHALSVEHVAAFAARSPLSRYASGEDAAALHSLEQALVQKNTALLYEADAVEYLKKSAALVGQALPPEVEHALVELMVEVHNESAGYEYAAKSIIGTETENLNLVRKGVPVDLQTPYALFFRSALPFAYTAYNPSVIGGRGIEPYASIPSEQKKPYVFYSELPHTEALRQKLIHDMRLYRTTHIQAADAAPQDAFK